VKRFWLFFDISTTYPRGWPPVLGVTGWDLRDCLAIVERRLGPDGPPLTGFVENPDLSDIAWDHLPGRPAGLGVPVWRGIWSPPWNLTQPEPRR
jgi:hypothetical protein